MVNMKATFFLKLLAVSAVLGLACAAVDIEKIAASPELVDLDTADTEGDADFSAPQKISKEDKDIKYDDKKSPLSDLEKLKNETALPPLELLTDYKASAPPLEDPTKTDGSPPQVMTAVSGAPILNAQPPVDDLKKLVDSILIPSPPATEEEDDEEEVKDDNEDDTEDLDKDEEKDSKKKKDLLKKDPKKKDDKNLEVPIYTYSFEKASPPKKDILKEKKSEISSALGRRMF